MEEYNNKLNQRAAAAAGSSSANDKKVIPTTTSDTEVNLEIQDTPSTSSKTQDRSSIEPHPQPSNSNFFEATDKQKQQMLELASINPKAGDNATASPSELENLTSNSETTKDQHWPLPNYFAAGPRLLPSWTSELQKLLTKRKPSHSVRRGRADSHDHNSDDEREENQKLEDDEYYNSNHPPKVCTRKGCSAICRSLCDPNNCADEPGEDNVEVCTLISTVACGCLGDRVTRIGNMSVFSYTIIPGNKKESSRATGGGDEETGERELTKEEEEEEMLNEEKININVILGPYWPMLLFITYPLIIGISLMVGHSIIKNGGIPWYIILAWLTLTMTVCVSLYYTG